MFFFDETGARLFVWNIEFNANHEAFTTNVHHMRKMACSLFCLERVDEILADFSCILHKVFLLHHVEHSDGASTTEVIATECGA